MQCKNGSIDSRGPPRPNSVLASYVLPFFSPLSWPSIVGSYQPYHLPFQRWPWWKTRPIGSSFVIWQESTGSVDQARFSFICVQSQDFNLVKGCGIYFLKVLPKLFFFSFNCLLGLRWLLNALNYAGSLFYFWTPVRNSDHGWSQSLAHCTALTSEWGNPRSLTKDCVLGGWVEA